MTEDMYYGIAKLPDGKEVRITGTILECANWADNMIRNADGEVIIEIRREQP